MHTLFRKITTFLCLNRSTYLLGMVFVRISRFIRSFSAQNDYKSEQYEIVNFMGCIKMKVNIHSYMGGSIYWTGFHQLNELLFLKKYLKNDMNFVDIGANQGEFTIYAASLLQKGAVMAFEPVQKIRSLLNQNVLLNNFSNVEVFDFGLSNERNLIPIYTSIEQDEYNGFNEGLSSLFKTDVRSHLEQMVEVRSFDDEFYDKIENIDFVKIDIEGSELYALQGMRKTLEKFKPVILIEINEETFKAAGYSTKDLIDFFTELDYEFYSLHRGNEQKIQLQQIKQYGNYVMKNKTN